MGRIDILICCSGDAFGAIKVKGVRMEKTKERLSYIDMVKGLSIICVVLTHIYGVPEELKSIISHFDVTVFYTVSGLLTAYNEGEKHKDIYTTIKRGIVTLIIPYLFFCSLFIVVFIFQGSDENYIKIATQSMFSLLGIGALWFIPCLFITRIVFFGVRRLIEFINKKTDKNNKIVIFISMGLILLLGINFRNILPRTYITAMLFRIIVATALYSVGYYLQPSLKKIQINIWVLIILLAGCFFIAIQIGVFQVWDTQSANLSLSVIISIIESICIIMLFQKLPNARLLEYCGKNSMILLGTNQILLIIIYMLGVRSLFLTIISLIILEIITITILNKFLPFCIRKEKVLKLIIIA